MECKNCNNSLRTEYSYCPDCGAKVMRNRLTVKNLWNDATERFFNIDNTFLITFKHLFTKPDDVIGGYINGVRKKYVNPLGYFAFSVVLSGLMFLIIKKGYHLTLFPKNMSGSGNLDKIIDYQAFITYLAIPAYAIASFLTFLDKNKFNLTEHVIINIYWLAHFTIVQFFLYVIILGVFDVEYATLANYFMIPVVLYMLFILKKLHSISFKSIFLRGFLYFPLYFIAATSTIIPVVIYMFIVGELNLEDFAPK